MTIRIRLLSLCLLSFLANHGTLVNARFWWQSKNVNIGVDGDVDDVNADHNHDVEDLDEQDHDDLAEEDPWDDRPTCSHDELSEEDFKACIDKTFYSDHEPTKLDDRLKSRYVNQRSEEYLKEQEIRAKERTRHLKEEREKRRREDELEYTRILELQGASGEVDEEKPFTRGGPSIETIRKREALQARYPAKPMLYAPNELPSHNVELIKEGIDKSMIAESSPDNIQKSTKKAKMSMKGSKRGMKG